MIVVSDALVSERRAPIPSLLAVGSVHQRLLHRGLRTRAALLASAGDVRDTHDLACLLGFGAEVVCPRTAVETITALAAEGRLGAGAPPAAEAVERFLGALEDGVLKVMSKMGIATVDAYRGAQIFETLGLDDDVLDLCLTGTPAALGGVGFEELGQDVLARHAEGY